MSSEDEEEDEDEEEIEEERLELDENEQHDSFCSRRYANFAAIIKTVWRMQTFRERKSSSGDLQAINIYDGIRPEAMNQLTSMKLPMQSSSGELTMRY
jgi:hypothetical protein